MSSAGLPMPAPGTRIGSYRLTRPIGHGGMGAVFEAVHEGIGGRAAIKILRIDPAVRLDITKRFFDEARAANSIEHPSIIRIFDAGQTPEGLAYLAMEFLNGDTLAHRITRLGRLSVPEAIRLARQVASALSAVHERGVIHRDLKPENLMLVGDPEMPGGERLKVLDFGIARLAADLRAPGSDTMSGIILGTPTYMSPEQCHGAKQVTAQSDVYSLGVILYKMLAGRAPFVSQGAGALMSLHLTEQPVPIREHRPEVPGELAKLLHAMLEKAPTARPTMREVDAALRVLVNTTDAQPSTAPNARHEAVTRKLSPVDLPGLFAPAGLSSAERPATRPPPEPEQTQHRQRPHLVPSSTALLSEVKTLSKSLRRRLLIGSVVGVLAVAAGVVTLEIHVTPSPKAARPSPPDASLPRVLIPAAPSPDLSARVVEQPPADAPQPDNPAAVPEKAPAAPVAATPATNERPAAVPSPKRSPASASAKGEPADSLGTTPLDLKARSPERATANDGAQLKSFPQRQVPPPAVAPKSLDGEAIETRKPVPENPSRADEDHLRNPFGK